MFSFSVNWISRRTVRSILLRSNTQIILSPLTKQCSNSAVALGFQDHINIIIVLCAVTVCANAAAILSEDKASVICFKSVQKNKMCLVSFIIIIIWYSIICTCAASRAFILSTCSYRKGKNEIQTARGAQWRKWMRRSELVTK